MNYAWFIIPYVTDKDWHPNRNWRRLSLVYHDNELEWWKEVEVKGNHAIVLAAGTEEALANVASKTGYTRLPALHLADKLGEVSPQERSTLIDILHGVGYTSDRIKRRLRTPDLSDVRLAEYLEFLRQERHLPYWAEGHPKGEIGFTNEVERCEPLPIAHLNAFPVNAVLDNFNRANGALGANWGNGAFTPETAPVVNGNLLTNGTNSGTGYLGASWAANTSMGPDVENYITVVATDSKGMELLVRGANLGASTFTGYSLFGNHSGSGTWTLNRYASGVPTGIGSGITQAIANGDSIGLFVSGTTLQAYRQPSAGAWATMGASATDSTYTAAGIIALEWQEGTVNQSHSGDNFGGGTVSSTTSVTKTLTPSYNVIAHLVKTQTSSYNVRNIILKTENPSYTVRKAILKTVTPSYQVLGTPPVNTVPPAISGTPLSGQILTVSTGTWSNSPTSYTYQWQVEDSPGSGTYSNIPGETNNTLQL